MRSGFTIVLTLLLAQAVTTTPAATTNQVSCAHPAQAPAMQPLTAEARSAARVIITLEADSAVADAGAGDMFTVTPAVGGKLEDKPGEDTSIPRPVKLTPFLHFTIPLTPAYKASRAKASAIRPGETGFVLLTGPDRATALELAKASPTTTKSPVKKPISSPFQEGAPIRVLAVTITGDPVVQTAFDFTVGVIYDKASGRAICEIARGVK